mgnify:CR=1 FL=1
MKHKPQIVQASRLADVACEQCDGEYQRFPEVLTTFGEFKTEAKGKWFACVWGDNCVTTQHLGDATIHGPYDTEVEAKEIHCPDSFGTLYDYQTGDAIRPATRQERDSSDAEVASGNHEGVIAVDWRTEGGWNGEDFRQCYVAL